MEVLPVVGWGSPWEVDCIVPAELPSSQPLGFEAQVDEYCLVPEVQESWHLCITMPSLESSPLKWIWKGIPDSLLFSSFTGKFLTPTSLPRLDHPSCRFLTRCIFSPSPFQFPLPGPLALKLLLWSIHSLQGSFLQPSTAFRDHSYSRCLALIKTSALPGLISSSHGNEPCSLWRSSPKHHVSLKTHAVHFRSPPQNGWELSLNSIYQIGQSPENICSEDDRNCQNCEAITLIHPLLIVGPSLWPCWKPVRNIWCFRVISVFIFSSFLSKANWGLYRQIIKYEVFGGWGWQSFREKSNIKPLENKASEERIVILPV